jgi:hypothetical protein
MSGPSIPERYAQTTKMIFLSKMIFLLCVRPGVGWVMVKNTKSRRAGQANHGWLDTHYTFGFGFTMTRSTWASVFSSSYNSERLRCISHGRSKKDSVCDD